MNPNKNYIGAGLVALALIGAWGWVLPEYNKISELNIALEERQELYDSRSVIVQRIQDLNKEYQQRAADITKISSVLPSKKSLAEIVSAIDKLSSQSGLQLISATVAGKPSDSQVGAYNSLPIEISMGGSYPGHPGRLPVYPGNSYCKKPVSNRSAEKGPHSFGRNYCRWLDAWWLGRAGHPD